MPNIPLITAKQPTEVGAPQAQANADAFGANVGRALMGFGEAVQGFGGAIGNLAQKRQNEANDLTYATENANFDFTPDYLDLTINTPPDQLHDTTDEAYTSAMNERLGQLQESGTPKEVLDKLRITWMNDKARFTTKAAVDGFTGQVGSAQENAKTSISTQVNSVLDSADNYQTARGLVFGVIDAMPGDQTDKIEQRRIASSQLGIAYFQAQVTAADDPTDYEGIANELGSDYWKGELDSETYQKVVNFLDAAKTSKDGANRALFSAQLQSVTERTTDSQLVSDDELRILEQQSIQYGTPATQLQFQETISRQQAIRNGLHKPAYVLMGVIETQQNKGYNNTDATAFLQTRLNAGKPSYYITNMAPRLQTRLAALIQAAPPGIREYVSIVSGARSEKDQARILANPHRPGYVGSVKGSKHVKGEAADLGWKGGGLSSMPENARAWLHAHASEYGLKFRMNSPKRIPYEPWHIETVEASGGTYGGNIGGGARGGTGGGVQVPPDHRAFVSSVETRYSLPSGLLAAVWRQESGGKLDPGVNKKSGATGPFQFMPDAWTDYGQGGDRHDFQQAGAAAGHMLSDLLKKYGGNLDHALMAYNWGPKNVDDWLRDGGNVPTETSEYVVKVKDFMGSGQGVAALGAPASGGQPGLSHNEWAYMDQTRKMLDARTVDLGKNTADVFSLDSAANSYTPPPLMSESGIDPAAFAQRSQDMTTFIEQERQAIPVQADDVKPFTSGEMIAITDKLANGNLSDKAMLYAAIGSMSKDMQSAAYKQIGEKDAIGATAGEIFQRDAQAGMSVIAGAKILADDKERRASWGSDPYIRGQYNEFVGDATSGFSAELQGNMRNAADAIYADMTARTPNAEFDPAAYQAAIAKAWGMKVTDVNGVQTFVLPGVGGGEVETWMDSLDAGQWMEANVDKKLPVTGNGVEVDPDDMSGARLEAVDNQGHYAVLIDNGYIGTGERDESGRLKKFIVEMTPERIQRDLEDAAVKRATLEPADVARVAPGPDNTPLTGLGMPGRPDEAAKAPKELPAEAKTKDDLDKQAMWDAYYQEMIDGGIGKAQARLMADDYMAETEK